MYIVLGRSDILIVNVSTWHHLVYSVVTLHNSKVCTVLRYCVWYSWLCVVLSIRNIYTHTYICIHTHIHITYYTNIHTHEHLYEIRGRTQNYVILLVFHWYYILNKYQKKVSNSGIGIGIGITLGYRCQYEKDPNIGIDMKQNPDIGISIGMIEKSL